LRLAKKNPTIEFSGVREVKIVTSFFELMQA